MKKTWLDYLIDPNTEMLGLKTDTVNMKGWINQIVEYIDSIKSNEEAIKTLFVINQKIGYVKGQKNQYHYPTELYDRLQITVNKLLHSRLNKEKSVDQDKPLIKSGKEIQDELKAAERTIENYQKAYKDGKIPFEVLKTEFVDKTATIQALKWVLGENDRFD